MIEDATSHTWGPHVALGSLPGQLAKAYAELVMSLCFLHTDRADTGTAMPPLEVYAQYRISLTLRFEDKLVRVNALPLA